MSARPLLPQIARRTAQKLNDELGRADRERLATLLSIMRDDGRINLGEALRALYAGQTPEAAQAALRQFRKRLGEVAQGVGVRLALQSDSRKKTPLTERWCWFEGEDGAVEILTQTGQEESAFVQRSSQGAFLLRDGKPLIRYFISYAHDDATLKTELCRRLKKYLDLDSAYSYEEWQDPMLLAGDKWHAGIERAIERCHFGLLLVTPSFLGSTFITRHELPSFVARDLTAPEPDKRAIPVALDRLLFDGSIDLKGLQHIQIFHDKDSKPFSERTGTKKNDFARQLFQQIRLVVGGRILPESTARQDRRRLLEHRIRREIDGALDGCGFVRTEAFSSSLDKLDSSERSAGEPRARIDALTFLNEWATDPHAPHYFALLGELGIGKTTTCLAFARHLLEQRQQDPNLPLPIYLDLRMLGEQAATTASLEEMLAIVLRGKWQGGHLKIDVEPREIVRLVQEEGALAILDGLDEVLVHLTPRGEQRFLRELLKLLPPLLLKKGGGGIRKGSRQSTGRLLLSCRTHYFPTLRAQKNLLLTEERDGVTAEDYRALVLMPFTEKQIIAYLKLTLPDQDPERLLELIRSVHNLSELAERPYTLSLIAREIPQIERWKMEGKTVTGVTLYKHMVQSWLERDAGKHTLTPTHKQRIMEHFAGALHQSKKKTWSVEDVEQWLIDFLITHPRIAAHYEGRDRELLKEDLRTATFLVREGEDQFRFAHTSLLEFFLSCHLYRGLQERELERWDIPKVSRETLDFLGQLLAEDANGRDKALAALRSLLCESSTPQPTEQALAFALLAGEKGYPTPSLVGICVSELNLRGWKFHGTAEAKLNLRGSNWRAAKLEGCSFRNVDLDGVDFSETSLDRAEFIDCLLPTVRFNNATLPGTIFRNADLRDADFSDCKFHRTKWLHCDIDSRNKYPTAIPPDSFMALCGGESPSFCNQLVSVMGGHTVLVNSMAFSPDGDYFVTAGWERGIYFWDTKSCDPISVLSGHESRVISVVFSPIGNTIASAGEDGTICIWSVKTGSLLAALSGHEKAVNSIVFSPDGQLIASAGADGTVRLWDARSTLQIEKLMGHEDVVNSVTFSPDGRTVVSAGEDGTVRLWNIQSACLVTTLSGHDKGVNSVSFSPDGSLFASAGDDGTIRLWRNQPGYPVIVLTGHEKTISNIVFSPDGRVLASVGHDGTLRTWDVRAGSAASILATHIFLPHSITFTPDGNSIVIADWGADVRTIDVTSGESMMFLNGRGGGGKGVFTPDGATLVTVGNEQGVQLWNVQNGNLVTSFKEEFKYINAVAISPDESFIAIAEWGEVQIWDIKKKTKVTILNNYKKWLTNLSFSPDGSILATKEWGQPVNLWDAKNGKLLASLAGKEEEGGEFAFSPDGKLLASAGKDGVVDLWNVQSGESVAVLNECQNRISSMAFSSDGDIFAYVGADGCVHLWNVQSRQSLTALHVQTKEINAMIFSPDGSSLAVAEGNGVVRIWDVYSGENLFALSGHLNAVSKLSFCSDGSSLASFGNDASFRLWDLTTGKEIRQTWIFENSWAIIDPVENRIVQVAGEAWRWLGWNGIDPATGRMERWPAETFGPLPEWTPPAKTGIIGPQGSTST